MRYIDVSPLPPSCECFNLGGGLIDRADEGRPTCINCGRLKLSCGGYRRGRIIFLDEGWEPHGVSTFSATTNSASNSGTQASKMNQKRQAALVKESDFSVQGRLSKLSDGLDIGQPQISLLPDKMQIYISFFVNQLSRGDGDGDFLYEKFRYMSHHHASGGQAVDINQRRLREVGPLYPAMKGLVMGYFAKVHCDQSLLRDGTEFYILALRRMREQFEGMDSSAVANDNEWEDTAFACLLLGLFEVSLRIDARRRTNKGRNTEVLIESDQLHTGSPCPNWHSHISALARMIECRGPELLARGSGLKFLLNVRLFIVSFLEIRRPSLAPERLVWLSC